MSLQGLCRKCLKSKIIFHFNYLCYDCWSEEVDKKYDALIAMKIKETKTG